MAVTLTALGKDSVSQRVPSKPSGHLQLPSEHVPLFLQATLHRDQILNMKT